MRAELETRMLHLQPSELLLQTDLSGKTEAMVKLLAGQHKCVLPGSSPASHAHLFISVQRRRRRLQLAH